MRHRLPFVYRLRTLNGTYFQIPISLLCTKNTGVALISVLRKKTLNFCIFQVSAHLGRSVTEMEFNKLFSIFFIESRIILSSCSLCVKPFVTDRKRHFFCGIII